MPVIRTTTTGGALGLRRPSEGTRCGPGRYRFSLMESQLVGPALSSVRQAEPIVW
jgi:hypothetical protein